jgi:hypothetical protein
MNEQELISNLLWLINDLGGYMSTKHNQIISDSIDYIRSNQTSRASQVQVGSVRCKNGDWFGYINKHAIKSIEAGDLLYTCSYPKESIEPATKAGGLYIMNGAEKCSLKRALFNSVKPKMVWIFVDENLHRRESTYKCSSCGLEVNTMLNCNPKEFPQCDCCIKAKTK